MIPSSTDENRDLRKQIGCMNGIFQLFDRHHILTSRRANSKRLLLPGAQHRPDPQHASKAVTGKDLELRKEKPRISIESSRASYSSPSCSPKCSSLDGNRTAQAETPSLRQINVPQSQFHITARKGQQPSLTESKKHLDLQDVVKESMHREARGSSIKSERRGHVLKHIDSPRPPLQQFKSGKQKAAAGYEEIQEGTPNYKDERLALPRFSYDGRESRETFKSAINHKELPRLSLDSKAASMKNSAKESRLNFIGRDLSQMLPVNQEPGSHNRSSSVVAKLMGLDAFPDTTSTDEIELGPNEAFLTKDEGKQNQVSHFRHVSDKTPSSLSPRLHYANAVMKQNACSRLPVEPASWRQKDSNQGSSKMDTHRTKPPTSTSHLSSSVYGEIEKRITDLEFKRSGKDLRALKHILEAMHKTRETLENQQGELAEFATGKPTKVVEKVNILNQHRLQTQNLKCQKENSSHRQREKDIILKKNNLKGPGRHLLSPDKSTSRMEQDTTLTMPQRIKVQHCTTSRRSIGMRSPRSRQNLLRVDGRFNPTNPSDSGRVKRLPCKELAEKGPQNRTRKSKDLWLSDDQLSELSSERRCSSYQLDTASVRTESNNCLVSQIELEREVMSLVHSINTIAGQKENSSQTMRECMPSVESAVTMLEQPSPVSVLDDILFRDDSPSPVKKISTPFQEDESPSLNGAEWHLEDRNHLTGCRNFDHGYKYNEEIENMEHSVCEPRLLNIKPDKTAAEDSVHSNVNPDQRYISRILQKLGLPKEASFISTTDQLLSSWHLINPDMFHVLELTEDAKEGAKEERIEKNDWMALNTKIQRNMIFDMVNEILVRRITSSRVFTLGNKKTGPQGLLKEVYLEIDRVSKIPGGNLEGEDDKMIRLLTMDMTHQSEDWAGYSGEIPALVLDIERLIFKDIINEVVAGECMGLHGWPKRHCRQLF